MTSSLAGYLDLPGSPQYNAAKFGVRGLMRALRRTGSATNMRVNIIAPWFVRTPIIADPVQDLLESKGIVFAEKEDVAAAVMHLASDRSINGGCGQFEASKNVLARSMLMILIGRALTIVPRHVAAKGYVDYGKDDFPEGDLFSGWQDMVMGVLHRVVT